MTKRAENELLDRMTQEMTASPGFVLPIHLDLPTLLSLVGALQLSLRHPRNTGPTSQIVRQLINGIIDRIETHGFKATAELMRLGFNPEHDI